MNAQNATSPSQSREPGVDELRAELKTLRDDVRSLLDTTRTVLQAKSEAGKAKGRAAVHDVSERTLRLENVARESVRRNPLGAVSLALGIGAFIGMLRSK